MAGNLSVQTCGELFANPSRQASSNYGIDSKGTIAMYVEEKNRSWCSSNKANDQRAITIEVASINTTDYQPSDAAYNALILLITDICKRNNIKQLLWRNDKALIGQIDLQNMTVHRWFASKSCPAAWLLNHHPEIVSKVNANLLVVSAPVVEPETTEGTTEAAKTFEELIWDFLDDKGLNDFAKAGIMGNLFAESGFESNNLQNTFEKKLSMNDDQYTAAVDNGSYTNFVQDGAGYGLAQWTYWSRKQNLLNFAKAKGVSIANFQMQLDFLWDELNTSYKGLVTTLKAAKSVKEASDAVLIKFENPGGYGNNMPDNIRNTRCGYSQNIYNKYATADNKDPNTTVTALPYKVKVTTSCLRIRAGAGTDKKINGNITDYGVYTIVEEGHGKGANLWGKLKSGAGWIAIDPKYNKKV